MSTTKKLTGIIYRAYNTVSQKSYIGQTTQSLTIRIRDHYRTAKISAYKFPNALNAYPKNVWVWEILKEVDFDQLDYYERFFIADLDTIKNGYNILVGGSWKEYRDGTPTYSTEEHTLYHPEYGEITAIRSEWVQRDVAFQDLSSLVQGKRPHIRGWVLLENKETYFQTKKKVRGRVNYDFYNPKYGEISCTPVELQTNYVGKSYSGGGCGGYSIYGLVNESIVYFEGWVLAKNREQYQELANTRRSYNYVITLTHSTYGTKTLSKKEFRDSYQLSRQGICCLLAKRITNHKGWIISEEK